ncbi:MAG: ComEC family competence protein [Candidatus Omnitrophica bacterium]|nr:ComEC family competence protein [Candidatus Omnitrophota bacterium]MBU2222189.1 ComEC family competence protein [Candidatus Omnitrophota bacterium]
MVLLIAGAVLLFLSCLFKKKPIATDILLLLFCFFAGGIRSTGFNSIPKDHISNNISFADNKPVIIKGYVSASPDYRKNKTCFKFFAQEINQRGLKFNSRGETMVIIKGKSELKYGESLILDGNLRRPVGNYREYLKKEGIYSILYVPYAGRIISLKQNDGFVIKRFALWIKEKAESIIFRRVSFLSGSILDAMVLGEKRNIPAAVNTAMIKTGTVHILVVSGFNVGLVGFIMMLCLKILRLPRTLRGYLTIGLLLVYCFLTGSSTPVIRATVMGIMFILAQLLQRDPDIYDSLSLAALFILARNPNQLFDIGFQLSFISVASIVFLYPKFRSLVSPRMLKIKYLRYLIDGLLVSLAAWLGTMGIIAYNFRIFSPITIVANLFIVPAASLITLCGFSLIAAELILPGITHFFARFCELMVWILLSVNSLLLKIPGSSVSF